MTPLSNHHYLIVGASSLTGSALANFLSSQKATYSISDIKVGFSQQILPNLEHKPVQIYDNPIQTEDQLNGIDIILLSPGVPRSLPFLKNAVAKGIPIIGEIAFVLTFLKEKGVNPFIVGVSGSNGKSTTCALTAFILSENYKNGEVYLLGNFGIPFITKALELKDTDIVILELSSYQLEDAHLFNLNIGALVNISPNHLDRYDSFKDYENAKMNLFKNHTKQDKAIVPQEFAPLFKDYGYLSDVLVVDSQNHSKTAVLSLDSNQTLYIYDKVSLQPLNIPNHLKPMKDNILISIAVCIEFHISMEHIQSSLLQFKGLEHRSEFVGIIDDIQVINDSKATTPKAVELHLNHDENTVIIVGGKNKNLDFTYLKPLINDSTTIVFYGACGQDIQNQLDLQNSPYHYDFKEAIHVAYQLAKEQAPSNLILSPGCTSFDQFESFVKRGLFFKEVVYEINK